jgi:hypothetical protein
MDRHGLTGTLTGTCTVEGQTATMTLPVPQNTGGDAAAVADIRVALEDGGHSVVPWSGGNGIDGEITIDLTYDDDGDSGVADVARPRFDGLI